MALENSGSHSGKYITDLDSNNPAATDPLAQADEHLRYIKGILNNSFGSITGAVTATHTQINNKCAEPLSAITSDGANPAVVSLGTNVTQASLKTLIGVDGLPDPAIVNNAGTISIASTATEADVWSAIKNEAFKTIYPVGSIYVSVDSSDPNNLFGGTWVAVSEGQVLTGHSTSDATFTAGNTGGNSTFSLTADNLPRHRHNTNIRFEGDDAAVIDPNLEFDSGIQGQELDHNSSQNPDGNTTTTQDNLKADDSTNQTATSTDINLHQPYLVVYMWKRTVL